MQIILRLIISETRYSSPGIDRDAVSDNGEGNFPPFTFANLSDTRREGWCYVTSNVPQFFATAYYYIQ